MHAAMRLREVHRYTVVALAPLLVDFYQFHRAQDLSCVLVLSPHSMLPFPAVVLAPTCLSLAQTSLAPMMRAVRRRGLSIDTKIPDKMRVNSRAPTMFSIRSFWPPIETHGASSSNLGLVGHHVSSVVSQAGECLEAGKR